MKRIAAIALALALLLAAVGACAEYAEPAQSPVSTLLLTKLTVSGIGEGKSRAAKLDNMSLSLSAGRAEGVPTLQISFDNGKGQLLDLILQVFGTRLLMSAGGISGTYYVDLAAVSGDPLDGARLAQGLGEGLALAGPHMDALLQGLSTEDADGVRMVRFEIPGDVYDAIAESLLKIAGGLDFAQATDMDALEHELEETKDTAALVLRYTPAEGTLELDAVQGGKGLRLKADMDLSVQPMGMVNISADESMYDLTALDAARLFELRGELAIIALKYGHFAGGTGLSRIVGR